MHTLSLIMHHLSQHCDKHRHDLRTWASGLLCLLAITCQGADLSNIPVLDPAQLSGTWYEIARLPYTAEHDWQQVSTHFALEQDDRLTLTLRGYSAAESQWQQAVAQARFADKADHARLRSGILRLTFDNNQFADWQQLTILEIDKPYYNYALVCSDQQHLWILSRTPQLTYPIKQHLMAKAKELGFATDQLIFVKQANQVEYEAGRHVMPQHN